jgi:hypothetical protein
MGLAPWLQARSLPTDGCGTPSTVSSLPQHSPKHQSQFPSGSQKYTGTTNGQFSGHVAAFRHLKKPHKLLNKRKAREADATPPGKRPTILLNTSQTNKEIAQKREAFFAHEYCRNMRLLLPNASDDGLFKMWYTYGSGDGFPCILFGQLACRAHQTCGCFFQLLFLSVEFQRLS